MTEPSLPTVRWLRLGDSASFFCTRERGRQFREQIEAFPAGDVVILDWAGVEVITGGFADELVGKLMGVREVACLGECMEVWRTLNEARTRRAALAEGPAS